MRKLYTAANGCGVLRHETNRIVSYFLMNDFAESSTPEDADIILFVACGMTNEDVNFDLDYINYLCKSRSNIAPIIVTGCLPPVYNNIKELGENIIVYRYEELETLDQLIDARIPFSEVYYNIGLSDHLVWPKKLESQDEKDEKSFITKLKSLLHNSTIDTLYNYSTKGEYIWKEKDLFQIRIAYGCSYACSYCSTRISVGKNRSEPIDRIINQYRIGLSLGYKRFMLIGTELGNYGREIGLSIVELIKSMYQIDNSVFIGIRYIHPDCLVEFFDELLPFFQNGYIFYFCAAIQTASPDLLRRMNRNPNLKKFIESITYIRKNNYPVYIHSQIMIGFPGETIKDVFDTLLLIDLCQFNYVNVNKFSPRFNTPAYYMPNQISEEEKDFRFALVEKWLSKSRREALFNAISDSL